MTDDVVARAPGRVNLIGDHTDYTGGLALPMAIRESVAVRARPIHGERFRFESTALAGVAEFTLDDDVEALEPSWARYAWGALRSLADEGLDVPTLEAFVESDLPVGGGLASSAALIVATSLVALRIGRSLGVACPESLTAPLALARACRRAEFVGLGVGCGLMDPYVSLVARFGCALRIDCTTSDAVPVPVDPARFAFVIADSGMRHELAAGGYEARRRDCAQALATMQAGGADVGSLREVTAELVAAHGGGLSPESGRRVRHVVSENRRVDAAVTALSDGDAAGFGALLDASHASLRDDFDVSCPAVDALVERARALPGVAGARMTGGGFGGYVLVAVEPRQADAAAAALAGFRGRRVKPSPGAMSL